MCTFIDKIRIIALFTLFFSLPALSQNYTCPTTYQNISVGDTLEKVKEACGKPAKETSKEIPIVNTEPTEQWTYSSPGQNPENIVLGDYEPPDDMPYKAQPLVSLIITFDKNDKIT